MRHVRPDDVEWAIDAAAKQAAVYRQLILSQARQEPLAEVRRGLYWFFRADLGWSFPRIARALYRDHSTIVRAIRMHGEPKVGDVSFGVWRAVASAYAKRQEQERAKLASTSSRVAHVGCLMRVTRPDSAGVVGIEMFHNGRMLPTRREWAVDVRGLADDSDPRYYRVAEVPAWMGTVVLVPVSEAEWNEATQHMRDALKAAHDAKGKCI